jgi:hypothetical protein
LLFGYAAQTTTPILFGPWSKQLHLVNSHFWHTHFFSSLEESKHDAMYHSHTIFFMINWHIIYASKHFYAKHHHFKLMVTAHHYLYKTNTYFLTNNYFLQCIIDIQQLFNQWWTSIFSPINVTPSSTLPEVSWRDQDL